MHFGRKAVDDVRRVLKLAPDVVNLADDRGFTPIMFAVRMGSKIMAEILLNHDADVNVKSLDGETSLDIALQTWVNYGDFIAFMRSHGALTSEELNKNEESQAT